MVRELIKTFSYSGAKARRNRMMNYGWRPITEIKYIDPHFICVMEICNSHPHKFYGKYYLHS